MCQGATLLAEVIQGIHSGISVDSMNLCNGRSDTEAGAELAEKPAPRRWAGDA